MVSFSLKTSHPIVMVVVAFGVIVPLINISRTQYTLCCSKSAASTGHDDEMAVNPPPQEKAATNNIWTTGNGRAEPTLPAKTNNNATAQPLKNISSRCLQLNSKAWIEGPRFGNLRDPLMDEDFSRRMILDPLLLPSQPEEDDEAFPAARNVLGQSICHPQSRFLNMRDTVSAGDASNIRLWAVRLIFLAVHYHQHRLAIPEAEMRLKKKGGFDAECTTELLDSHGIGIFDYECPTAKFLLVPLSGNGLGANIRGGAVVGLLYGLASDRVVLFMNNATQGHPYLTSPWLLASCERHDFQCFFLPASPCTLTNQDIKNAYAITPGERRGLLRKGILPAGHENDKVWMLTAPFMPHSGVPEQVVERLYNYSQKLLNLVPPDDPRLPLLKEAAAAIRTEDKPRHGYNYAGATLKIQHALAFYAMRPNLQSAEKLSTILDEIIPDNFSPEHSIGLPIRGSDKCRKESECLSFFQHMQVTSNLWSKHLSVSDTAIDRRPTVLFTTESKDVVAEHQEFLSNTTLQKRLPFSFDFVTNSHDVTPNTGMLQHVTRTGQVSADDAMLSSISSLQAQLLPRVTTGNCCSNFHVLLNDFLSEGCGAASNNTFMCLQENEDMELKVCCGWHHDCKEEKRKFLENKTASIQ